MHGIDQSLDTGSYSQRDSLDEGGTAAGAPREGPLLAGAVVKDDWCDGTQPSEDGLSSYPVALENSSDECDEEEGYEGVTPRAESDSYSEVEDSADTEVVFVKEGVVVWPSRSERILGRLSLIKQHGVLFLAWLPYTPGSLLEDGSYHAAAGEMAQSMQSAKERTLYAVHPIPLTDIKAIHKHTPPLGNHKITITLASGVSLAPLYFQQGGIKAFFSALREHVPLLRSADDPGTYLVNDTAEPLQRCLTSMELTDVLLGGPPAGASSTFPPASGSLAQEGWQAAEAEVPLRAQVLDLVDRFSRSLLTAKVAASSFFANGLLPQFDDMLSPEDDYHPDKARHAAGAGATPAPAAGEPCPQQQPQHGRQQRQPASQLGLPPGATLAASFSSSQPDLAGAGGKGAPGCGAPLESGVFSVDGVPLRDEDVAEQQQQQQEQQQGGEGQAAQQQQQQVEEEGDNGAQAASTELGVFEVIERSNAGLTTSALWTRARPPPLSLEELNTFCDREGRLVDEASFRQRVFYGGVEPEARPLAWKWLLGLLPPGAGREERREREARQLQQYLCLRQQWQSIGKEQAARFAKWRERRARIEKDVRRTDRGVKLFSKERGEGQAMLRGLLLTYSLYNFDLGYVQGMSDLAAPILYVMRSQVSGPALSREEMRSIEAQAFWCFARLMDRMESNFSTDCTGMHAQLVALRRLVQLLDPPLYAHLEAHDCLNMYFAYRWCLLHFKRELPSFEEVLRLWEALWTGYPTPQLHLYICVAVFEHHRRKIMSEDLDFDGMLKFCVELSGRLDLPALLRDAEVLCNYAGEAGRECVAGLPVLPHMHGAAAAAGVPAAPASPPPAQSGGLVTVVGPGADMAAGRAGGRATGALQA